MKLIIMYTGNAISSVAAIDKRIQQKTHIMLSNLTMHVQLQIESVYIPMLYFMEWNVPCLRFPNFSRYILNEMKEMRPSIRAVYFQFERLIHNHIIIVEDPK